MEYKTYSPNPRLAAYIKCFWSLEGAAGISSSGNERIFPDGCIELVFHYGDRFKKHRPGATPEVQERAFIHGQITRFIELEPTGSIGIFSVRFFPNGLRPFIPFDAALINGLSPDIFHFWGKKGDELQDRVLNARTNEARVILVQSFLEGLLQPAVEKDRLVHLCVNTILTNGGNIPVDQLASSFAIGRRQLERKFIADVGLSPKLLSRIVRFQNVLQLIGQKQFSSLTMLAYEGGFYDQAHFIKDFKEFTGFNPKNYFSAELEMSKYLSAD